MKRAVTTGGLLALATATVIVVGSALDLEAEPFVLTGALAGAVVGLVPDRGLGGRLAGFVVGFAAAWTGFVLRAAVLPDSSAGRAVAAALTVLLCVLAAVVSRGRAPLWAALVGAGVLAGAYEAAYSAAPPEVLTTSVDAGTGLLLAAAVGFVVAAVTAPGDRPRPASAALPPTVPTHEPELI